LAVIETLKLTDLNELFDFATFETLPPPEPDKPLRVLFVCTGNTCRSPMAAAALNSLGAGRYIAESAGLFPQFGAPIARYAAEALAQAGIPSTPLNNYSAHTAQTVTEAMITAADRVIGITESHMLLLTRTYPAHTAKITAMKKDITDPFGGTREDYKRCLDEILTSLRQMFPLDREL
jgi:Protein-tyrosine-phosphatase